MTSTDRPLREIDAKGRTIRELLAGRKYSIDYYQREYKWEQKQVVELLNDLATKFLDSHEENNERSAVADYSHYFLGSIIISDKDGQKFIIMFCGQNQTRISIILLPNRQNIKRDSTTKMSTLQAIGQPQIHRLFFLKPIQN